MRTQLVLIDSAGASDWRLDERTKEVGRQGVAAARAVLERVEGVAVRPERARGRGHRSPEGRADHPPAA